MIRHGEALPGADEIEDGSYDAQPLSEPGRRQSSALARRMKKVSLAARYSSPIRCAIATVSCVGKATGLAICVHDKLREVGLRPDPQLWGNLESEKRAAAMRLSARYRNRGAPDSPTLVSSIRSALQTVDEETFVRCFEKSDAHAKRYGPNHFRETTRVETGIWLHTPERESSKELRTRLGCDYPPHCPSACREAYCHCYPLRAYIAASPGLERDFFFLAANTSISVLRVKGEQQLLIMLNDISHLSRSDRSQVTSFKKPTTTSLSQNIYIEHRGSRHSILPEASRAALFCGIKSV